MLEPDPLPAIKTPWGSATPPSGASAGDVPPIPIPDHTLIRRIGKGSYGEVWLARNALGVYRAVKIIDRRAFDADRPFEREFAGMQRFEPVSRSHESQLNILQVGRGPHCFYYVMELADDMGGAYASGGTSARGTSTGGTSSTSPHSSSQPLMGTRGTRPSEARGDSLNPDTYTPRNLRSELLLRGCLPVDECIRLGLALTTALENLHRHGLVHRDIKPSNIVFVNGIPKLADIGLVAPADSTMSFVGTEGYLPPEGPGTVQADLFSLGKVLYEISTGHDRQQFPELPTGISELPDRAALAEFNEVLLRACAPDVKQRYASAAEMHADLALLQSGGSARKQRKLAGQLRFVQRAGAVVTALAAVIAAGWLWQARQTHLVRGLANEKTRLAEENRKRVVQLDVANGVRLLDDKDPSAALLWFGDALPLVTNIPTAAEIHRIRIQQTLHQTPRLLNVMAESNGVLASAFSPDGGRVATATWNDKLALQDVRSGKVLWERLHDDKPIRQVRFAKDGRRLFVCSSEDQGRAAYDVARARSDLQLAEVLDAADGIPVFPRLASNLVCCAFSSDDRWMAVALTNYVVQLLDSRNGHLVVELKGHTNEITMLAFSDDGSLLASGSRDLTARLWRLPAGELAGAPLVHDQPVKRVALSADGRRLATATWESDDAKTSRAQLWDVENARRLGEPITEIGPTRALFFSPKGDILFTSGEAIASGERFVRLWNVASGLSLQRKLAFQTVRCWDFSSDGRMLALGTDSGFVSVWSTETWDLLFPPFRHTGWVESVHFSPDGSRLLTTSDDGTAKVWSLETRVESARLELTANLPGAPAQYARSRGQTAGPIPVFLTDGWLHLVDPDRLVEVQTLKARQTNAPVFGWVAGSTGRHWALFNRPLAYESPHEITLWEWQDGSHRSLELVHPRTVILMQFNADDSRFVTLAYDRTVRIWRTSDGTVERSIPVPESLGYLSPPELLPQHFDPSCHRLLQIYGETSLYLQLFDLATGQLTGRPFAVGNFAGHQTRMHFSPDGTRLASVGEDQHGTIVDFRTGELAVPQFKHGGGLHDLDWSPDSRRLITAGESAEVKLWDAATGEMLLSPMTSGEGMAHSAHWSADGRFIVTRCDDNQARVWDASTSQAITPFLAHSGYIRWACITPGNRLITASDPNLIRAWDLKPTPLAPDIIAEYAKFLSGRRLSAGGVLLALPAKELVELAQSLRARAPQLFE